MFQIKNYITNILDKKKLISFEYLFFLILIFFVFRSFEYLIYWYEAYQKAFYGNADHIFWDFEVYKCAADFFINNENPYKLTTDCSPSNKPFIFNYPPFTILIFLPFTLFGFTIAKTIWGLLLILLFINFLNLQKKLFNIKINYFIYSLIVIFSLDKTLIYSFFTGNSIATYFSHSGFLHELIHRVQPKGSDKEFGNYYALMIGVNEYDYQPPLSQPIKDVKKLKRVLEEKI